MVTLPLSEVKPGMKLAKDVILSDGRLLLMAGFYIKPIYLRKLEAFNITHITVEDTTYTPIDENEEEKVYNHARDTIKNIFTLVREGRNADMAEVEVTVRKILDNVISNETVMLQLTGIRDIDNYTFLHSVDVCIYSTILGKKLGYNEEHLMDLGMGSILHDIGKCRVPMHILQKPDKLTNEELAEMQRHAAYGYEIIKNIYGMNSKIARVAFQHHEKWDGTGYPLGLSSTMIDPFSRIVSLADVYDALTSDRVYKKRTLPHIAADYIKRNSGILFDPYIVELFVENIAAYGEGTVVLLSTGEVGSVIGEKGSRNTRQKVYVFANKSGPPVLQPYVVDLNERPDIDIIEVFV